jgi:hypothetical protein
LFQNTTITENNLEVNTLESSGLTKPEDLLLYKSVLNVVQFFDVIYNNPTCCDYKVLYKSSSTNRHTDTNQTFRAERGEENVPPELSSMGIAVLFFSCGKKKKKMKKRKRNIWSPKLHMAFYQSILGSPAS